jgi:hypothetical protein
MITSAILLLLLSIVNWAIGSMPLVSATGAFSSSVTAASGYISSIGQVFPILSMMGIFVFVLGFDTAWIFYQGIRWVYQKIPGLK